MLNDADIYALLENALTDVQKDSPAACAFSPDLRLGGKEGALDSLDTMLFLDRVEELLSARLGGPVTLITDEAFTAEENPFESMKNLAEYVKNNLSPEG